MGLDTVELVLAIEEEFGIDIADRDAVNLTTPRLVADYVMARVDHVGADPRACHSQAAFYRIRAALVQQFGARRREVRPDASIGQFLKGDLRTQWRQLATAIEASQLPKLRSQRRVAYPLLCGFPLATGVLLTWTAAPAWSIFTGCFAAWVVALGITDKLADQLPTEPATITALVPYVGLSDRNRWTHDYVLQRVIQITSIQVGIPAHAIGPDDHFVEDLGLD